VNLGAEPELVVRRNRAKATKGRKVRRVPLLPPARDALRAWRDHVLEERQKAREGRTDADVIDLATGLPAEMARAYVWPGDSGRPHARGYDAGWGTTWRKRLGLNRGVTFHGLRHTCGTHLLRGTWGAPLALEQVQVILGHESRTTTEIYAHASPEGGHAAMRRLASEMEPTKAASAAKETTDG
jgi:integrase/recombinase XerD